MNNLDHYEAGKNNWVTGQEGNPHYQLGQWNRAQEQQNKAQAESMQRMSEMHAESMKRMSEIRAGVRARTETATATTTIGTIRSMPTSMPTSASPSASPSTVKPTWGKQVKPTLIPGVSEGERRNIMRFLAFFFGVMALCGAGMGHPGNYPLMALWTVGGGIAGYLGGFLLTNRVFWGLAITGGVFYFIATHFH